MNGKDLFATWAPPLNERWTKFAKPALFVHIKASSRYVKTLNTPHVPADISQSNNNKTAIIVDLPGAVGVESGLALAKIGFMPVPLYNGIHEEKIGMLDQAVNNAPIVDALISGADTLRYLYLNNDSPPAFLLDSNRNAETINDSAIYDNRWSIELDDMPATAYMQSCGIQRIVVWTDGEVRKDLMPILESYRDTGLEIFVYSHRELVQMKRQVTNTMGDIPDQRDPLINAAVRQKITTFENARFGLMLIAALALVNLVFMFLIRFEPLWWTAPSIMWLVYLWVPEMIGDTIAVGMVVAYFVLYFLSQRRRHLMVVATALFGFETLVFYGYTLYYGIEAWFAGLGIILLVAPIIFIIFLLRGAALYKQLEGIGDSTYGMALYSIDEDHGVYGSGRRHFRGFRGYSGYGGSGRGGYRGGGYRGFGGGYGGGFGG